MQPLQFLAPVEVLEAAAAWLPFVVLALVALNLGTRFLAHRHHRSQAVADEELTRYVPHVASTAGLIGASFLFTVVEPHGGIVLSTLVLGAFVADFFEFEARRVEARNEMTVERPKAALTVSALVVLYSAYQALFFVIEPLWSSVV